MLPVYERLFDVKYNFAIFPFILIGYALFCSTTQLMTKSTESLIKGVKKQIFSTGPTGWRTDLPLKLAVKYYSACFS